MSKCIITFLSFLYSATHCSIFYSNRRRTMHVVEDETVKSRSCRTSSAQLFPFHSFFSRLICHFCVQNWKLFNSSVPILAICTKSVFVNWSKSVSGTICLKHKCAFSLICYHRWNQPASDEHVHSFHKTILFIRWCSRFVCQFYFTDFTELPFRYLLSRTVIALCGLLFFFRET